MIEESLYLLNNTESDEEMDGRDEKLKLSNRSTEDSIAVKRKLCFRNQAGVIRSILGVVNKQKVSGKYRRLNFRNSSGIIAKTIMMKQK